jgi:hypothetical protein
VIAAGAVGTFFFEFFPRGGRIPFSLTFFIVSYNQPSTAPHRQSALTRAKPMRGLSAGWPQR